MDTKKFFMLFMIMFMLFTVSGCGGSGGNTQNFSNDPISPDKPAPAPETKSDDIPLIPVPAPQSQDKPISTEPISTPTDPIISPDPIPARYTVTFYSNGGSTVSSITVQSGSTIKAPSAPIKSGCTFGGWYKDSSFNNTFTFGTDGDKITGDITLYAKWIETDRLRAEVAIGKISIGYQDGDNANSVTKNLTLTTFVNASGDVNISWSSNVPSVISNSGIVTRPSDNDVVVSLTAKVTVGSEARNKTFTVTVLHKETPAPSGYTVTFNSNGGSAIASFHTSSGGTVIMPENPVREGYVFAGWYKDEAFTEIFTFGADGDKITKDTTLYAQWLDEDLLIAEYSASEIVIGYANGDSSKHVTKNITLPTKIHSSDISWVSSSSAISSNGIVTRQDNDVDVTLTATAMYNGKSAEAKTFNIKVIRKRTRNNSDIKPLSVKNASSGDIEVTRNDSGDVVDIEGMYVSFDIRNADDALDAVTVLRYELGIRSPDTELETFLVTSDAYSSEYAFSQVHKGVKVWGRKLVVSVNSADKGDFLHSSFLSSDIVAKTNGKSDIGQAAAEEAAKNHYAEEVEADTEKTEKVIYSLEDYANNPVYAYIVRVFSISADNYIDDTVFVNASTSEIIIQHHNICKATNNICEASGQDELGNSVSFDVVRWTTLGSAPTYVMSDPTLHVVIRSNVYLPMLGNNNITLSGKLVESSTNTWKDGHVISAYSNIREIMEWWQKRFSRDALDDKGSTINIIVHAWGGEDNAGWEHHAEAIYVYDKAEISKLDHSYAVAVDMLAHETTHGVLQYITGQLPYRDAIGAINEAYADILACVRDENWKMGEYLFNKDNVYKLNCIRNIADPSSTQAMEKPSNEGLYGPISDIYQYYIDYAPDKSNDYNYVHKRSLKVSHAAYLMHESNDANGLTWKELGDVWYKSMHKGFDATSRFEDVQRCVIEAAKEVLPKSSQKQKLDVIKSAFSQLGYGSKATLTGTVTDYNTEEPIHYVDIEAKVGAITSCTYTGETGHFSVTIPEGICYIEITHKDEGMNFDYVVFNANMKLSAIAPWGGNVLNVKLVKPGSGSLSGRIARRTAPPKPAPNVTLKIRSGWNNQDGNPILTATTDSNGNYAFNLGENGAGYYTVEMVGNGYETATFNVTVSGQTEWQDEYINGGEDEPDVPTPTSPDVPIVSWDIPIDKAHFPDEGFRSYLLMNFDTNGDKILNNSEIANVTIIELPRLYNDHYNGIASLQGIKYFTSLQLLDCGSSRTTSLDVSNCTSLQTLNCSRIGITTLNISGCSSLQTLECEGNRLTKLELSDCSSLQTLNCSFNSLTDLDIRNCTALQTLNCDENQLKTLDVSSYNSLVTLYCSSYQNYNDTLESINASNCTSLQTLHCTHNGALTNLDVSNCTSLRELICYATSHSDSLNINVSGCTSMHKLTVAGMHLFTLDLSDCIYLNELDCSGNYLSTLDISKCHSLESLKCENNWLITLNVSGNISLKRLECAYNNLTTLNANGCSSLTFLSCYDNKLTNLNVNGCSSLWGLSCKRNNLTVLDLSDCPDLFGKYSYGVNCDDGVEIIQPLSSQTQTFALLDSPNYSGAILAVLPSFTPDEAGTYTFTVSFDREPPEGSSLILLANSEDIHGTFAKTESPLSVKVSADFMAGRSYTPIIVATSEGESQSGGCNAGIEGIILLTGIVSVLVKNRNSAK